MSAPTNTEASHAGNVLMTIANALVTLHKEQFGRGPTRARAGFASDDTLVCTLEEALLPAERALVELGEPRAVEEMRMLMQRATRSIFVERMEDIVERKVVAFSSATDPAAGTVWEIFQFESR